MTSLQGTTPSKQPEGLSTFSEIPQTESRISRKGDYANLALFYPHRSRALPLEYVGNDECACPVRRSV
jgi:hypothetical protein